jgi:hypothetical protein
MASRAFLFRGYLLKVGSCVPLQPAHDAEIFPSSNSCPARLGAVRVGSSDGHRPPASDESASSDRILWAWLSRIWTDWRSSLVLVKPDTVVSWHRQGFRLYWRWKSRHRGDGRPAVPRRVRDLIRRMSKASSLWGAPRIHGKLLKLGLEVSQATVSKYMVRHRKPPSQSWRAFLNNHAKDFVSIDFFTVPTVTFNVLFVFVILAHERRRIIHFNVTESPGAKWTAQQIVEAFPWDTAPRYLLRDRDGIHGYEFTSRVENMGIKDTQMAMKSTRIPGIVPLCTACGGGQGPLEGARYVGDN